MTSRLRLSTHFKTFTVRWTLPALTSRRLTTQQTNTQDRRTTLSETLKLWQSVEKTDPKYTKSFSRAGGFSGTAINATYLVRKATELWGPYGGEWGATVEDER